MRSALVLLCLFDLVGMGQSRSESSLSRTPFEIEELHRKDVIASKAGDVATLGSLWTEDGVALPPNHAPVIGIKAIREWLNQNRLDTTKLELTEYVLDFREIRVFGDTAFEWARSRVTVHPKGNAKDIHASGNLMRILKRESDGSWKVARAIWNIDQ